MTNKKGPGRLRKAPERILKDVLEARRGLATPGNRGTAPKPENTVFYDVFLAFSKLVGWLTSSEPPSVRHIYRWMGPLAGELKGGI